MGSPSRLAASCCSTSSISLADDDCPLVGGVSYGTSCRSGILRLLLFDLDSARVHRTSFHLCIMSTQQASSTSYLSLNPRVPGSCLGSFADCRFFEERPEFHPPPPPALPRSFHLPREGWAGAGAWELSKGVRRKVRMGCRDSGLTWELVVTNVGKTSGRVAWEEQGEESLCAACWETCVETQRLASA